VVTLSQFGEKFEIEASGGNLGGASVGGGSHVGSAPAGLEVCSFSNDCARAGVSDDASLDAYFENPVENERDRRALLVRAEQVVAGTQVAYGWLAPLLHDQVGQDPFETSFRLGDVRCVVLAAPRRVGSECSASPDLVSSQRRLLNKFFGIVVEPMAREGASCSNPRHW
jgi:hypothetical protein